MLSFWLLGRLSPSIAVATGNPYQIYNYTWMILNNLMPNREKKNRWPGIMFQILCSMLMTAAAAGSQPHMPTPQKWAIINLSTGGVATSNTSADFPFGKWFPDLYVAPLIVFLLLLSFGPWAFQRLTQLIKRQIDSALTRNISVHYHKIAVDKDLGEEQRSQQEPGFGDQRLRFNNLYP